MISPAFWMRTVSPSRMSLRAISSALCSVARATVEPASRTGSSSATGVITPVRPTCMLIERRTVSAWSGGNLNATAQCGNLLVVPARRWSSSRLTFTTAPSVGKGRSRRRTSSCRMASQAASTPFRTSRSSRIGKPQDFSRRLNSLSVAKASAGSQAPSP